MAAQVLKVELHFPVPVPTALARLRAFLALALACLRIRRRNRIKVVVNNATRVLHRPYASTLVPLASLDSLAFPEDKVLASGIARVPVNNAALAPAEQS